MEQFGRKHLNGLTDEPFALGEHALILEVFRYKSADGWRGDSAAERSAIWNHEREFLMRLLNDLAPCVLVACGMASLTALHALLGLTPEPPKVLRQAIGQVFKGRCVAGPISVCAAKYFSYPMRADMAVEAARAVRVALQRL